MRRLGRSRAGSLGQPVTLAAAAVAVLVLGACGSGSGGAGSTPRAARQSRSEARGGAVHRPQAERPKVRVPQVTGLRTPIARRRLHSRGLRLMTAHYPGTLGNPNYPSNCEIVSSQGTRAGALVPRGSAVYAVLGICKGQIVKLERKRRGS